MKKSKVLAALVATMAVGATCAFAANPFVDVPADSWAYKSVVSIANAGIIQGVDGTHFQGNRNITRYEAAEITAKAMAHAHQANAQQRAVINKLAQEFAAELNNLGVRVSNLEENVGNVKLTGDARVRYIHIKDTQEKDSSYDAKVALNAEAAVNDNVTVNYGIEYSGNFGDDKAAGEARAVTKKANVSVNLPKNINVVVGRQDFTFGQGYFYDGAADGVTLTYGGNDIVATAGFGKFKEDDVTNRITNRKVSFQQLEGFFGDMSSVGVYHANVMNVPGKHDNNYRALGAFAKINAGNNITVSANYESLKEDKKDSKRADFWSGKVQYGYADAVTPQSWDVWVEYLNADTFALPVNSSSWRDGSLVSDVRSWGVGVDYVLAKNVKLQAMQSFSSKQKSDKDAKVNEETRAQLVFTF